MSIDRRDLRWNGWGWVKAPDLLGERAAAVWSWMAQTLGVDALAETPAVAIDKIQLPASRLDASLLDKLCAAAGSESLKTDDYERAFHARGKSYPDLMMLRSGRIDAAPDAVVYPQNEEAIVALLRLAAEASLAVIPYGGGSSVVGGVNAISSHDRRAIVTLDLTRMNQILEINETAMTARVQPGIYGPQLEAALQERGYTLGHFPQSFEFSTLGGWIAHRGAGQFSNRYGKAEHWFVSARIATPSGVWTTENFPASAAGPRLGDLFVGSEGTLGVIVEGTVRLHRKPEARDCRGYLFSDFARGVEAARAIVQSGVETSMIRLSDADETYFLTALQMAGKGAMPAQRFCLMLVAAEGEPAHVEAAKTESRAIIEKHGGLHAGESFGESWLKSRFLTPYLRDPMLDRGIGVDTLETSTQWPNLLSLHRDVSDALAGAITERPGRPGAKGTVMCHVSHGYPDGASLYFTYSFLRDPADELGQWRAIKTAATEAILTGGGTLSHHHGVGTDHLPWIEREKGATGIAILRSIKKTVDPTGVLNPNKLIPDAG